jgi:hypothetical protein
MLLESERCRGSVLGAEFNRNIKNRTLIVQKFAENAVAKDGLIWDDVRYFLELARQGK